MATAQRSPSSSIPCHSRHSDGALYQSYSFNDVAHSRDLLSSLRFLRQTEDLCDVVLQVGCRSISSHKVVLAASSPYFRAMFTGKCRKDKFMLFKYTYM